MKVNRTENSEHYNNLEGFLQELSSLTQKYNLCIGGCGCCGSPFIDTVSDNRTVADCLYYNTEQQKYEHD